MDNEIVLSRYKSVCEAAGMENVLWNEPMKKHTSFRIGGPADCLINVTNAYQLMDMLDCCRDKNIPYFLLGNGTNLLVSDRGFRGVVFQMQKGFQKVAVENDIIYASSGVLLSTLAKIAADHSLTGLEFASGIPGTLGGALVMNAGAYGGEMKDVVAKAKVLKPGQGLESVEASELELGYRTSRFKHTDWIAICAKLKLKKGDKTAIEAEMERLKSERICKQPLDVPSAGSTFKRPEGYFAGKLIMDAGLRGFSVGDAAVSEKHCGFVINKGGATALDVRTLINEIIKRVKESSGVTLVPEVRFLGKF